MPGPSLPVPLDRGSACTVSRADVGRARVELAYHPVKPGSSPRSRVEKPESMIERIKRVGRSTLVGILATVIDQMIFQTCKRVATIHAALVHATSLAERATFGHHAFHPDDLG